MMRKLREQWSELTFDKKVGILLPLALGVVTGILVPVLLASNSTQSDSVKGAVRSTFIPCVGPTGSNYDLVSEPSVCKIFAPREHKVRGVNLSAIEWHGWGRTTAQATAIERGFGRYVLRVPVEVSASHPVQACGRRVYSILQATSTVGGTITIPLHTCGGPTDRD